MTETREISRDVYDEISNQAHDLFNLVNGTMNAIGTTGEWAELHDWMKLAGIIAGQAARAAGQAPDPDAPVPYVPAEGMRDLQAAAQLAARDGWTTT